MNSRRFSDNNDKINKSARSSTSTNRGKPSNTTSGSKSRFGYMRNRMFSNSSKRETDHVRESENALYLTYNPCNLYYWKDKFLNYSITKYGDAGVTLRDGEPPHYMDSDRYEIDQNVIVPNKRTHPSEYAVYIKTLELETANWYKQRKEFEDNGLKLYHDIWAHMCDDSKQLVKQYVDDFNEMENNSDYILLWNSIEQSHLTDGVETNAIIQMDTRRKLENLHQRNKQP
jgi:hypothetical protein